MANDGSGGAPRVISLLAASTEMVYRLGMGHCLVGRSHECDWPPAALLLPKCSDPNMDPNLPSIDIDNAVRAHAAAGTPIYAIHADKLVELKPTIILTQSHCRVCAVTEDDIVTALEAWAASQKGVCRRVGDKQAVLEGGARIITLEPNNLTDILRDVSRVADALGVPGRGFKLVRHLETRLQAVRSCIAPYVTERGRVRAACMEWTDPLMGCGSWIPQLVDVAGGEALLASPGAKVEVLSLEELAAADPDVLVWHPCGYGVARTAQELRLCGILERAEWQGMKAVRHGRVFVADGNQYFNRSGPRVLETAEMLAEMFWPQLLGIFGHHGDGFTTLAEALAKLDAAGKNMVVPGQATSSGEGGPASEAVAALMQRLAGATASPQGTVAAQIQLLQAADVASAFQLNSTTNQQRLGSLDMFRAVASQPLMLPLSDPATAITFGPVRVYGRSAEVPVCASEPPSPAESTSSISRPAPAEPNAGASGTAEANPTIAPTEPNSDASGTAQSNHRTPLAEPNPGTPAMAASNLPTQAAESKSRPRGSIPKGGPNNGNGGGGAAVGACHYYVFKLSQQAQGLWKGCWLTDGVRPAPMWDPSPPAGG